MPGRGPTTFQKRQKEQARKEKREEKLARRHQKKKAGIGAENESDGLDVENPAAEGDDTGPLGSESVAND
ncbi:MAG: hypothetical protein ACJ74Y_02450 [Bryobacteraceae bacterium]